MYLDDFVTGGESINEVKTLKSNSISLFRQGAHMSANLVENIKTCLSRLSVRKIYAWSGSTTFLHWLRDSREINIFVSHRVSKIKGKSFVEWIYVPMKENSVDPESRSFKICKLDNKWWKGPKWLQAPTQ